MGDFTAMNAASIHREAIEEELDRVLHAPSFRTSKRSRQFLQYVVQQMLDGHADGLKERSIGVAVFERPVDYDTSQDASVRVAAVEVRKRLAQCYVDSPPDTVRIVLPPGSYVPEFVPVHPPVPIEEEPSATPSGGTETSPAEPAPPVAAAPPPAAPRRPLLWPWVTASLVSVTILALLALRWWFLLPPGVGAASDSFEEFWGPAFRAGKPVMICVSHPQIFLLSDEAVHRFAARKGLDLRGEPANVEVQPKDLAAGDLVSSFGQYVGAGDAYAAAQFMGLFARRNQAVQMRIGNDVSFADLRNGPVVLIGAYSNRWTMQVNQSYRFGFDRFSVVDHQAPGQVWRLKNVTRDFRSNEDYAIVSRVLSSYTGEAAFTAAGITNMGTHSAAEFLANPAYLKAALAGLPAGWQKKSLQLVLHCRVIGSTPGPPEVVASHLW